MTPQQRYIQHTTRIADAIQAATFGFEVEYNKATHRDLLTAELVWLQCNGSENSVIKEDITTPTNVLKNMRRMAFLSEVLGHEYDEGFYDTRAGSVHMHCRTEGFATSGSTDIQDMNALLLFASHMKRTAVDEFRQAVTYRARIDTVWANRDDADDAYDEYGDAVEETYDLPVSTKTYWVCHNGGVDTIENRMNEACTGYVPMLLMPVVMNMNGLFAIDPDVFADGYQCIKFSGSGYVAGSGFGSSPHSPKPSLIEAEARKHVDHRDLLRLAIASYGQCYGKLMKRRGSISNALERLPIAVLQAALDGATAIEIHQSVVKPTMELSAVYNNMFTKLG